MTVGFRRGLTVENLRHAVRDTHGARRRAVRACMFLLASRLTPLVGVESGGVRYVLSSREANGIAFPTFLHGGFGEDTIEALLTALARHAGIASIEGLTVLEIGANIGTETVSFIARHGARRVIAVEPDRENVRFLRANLALNGIEDRVAVHQIALSDSDGEVMLERSEDNWGDHRVRNPGERGSDGRQDSLPVQARRLDSLIEAGEVALDDVGIVWMDAQGHEGHIFAGAQRLLESGVPIVTEYWPHGLREVGTLERFHSLVTRHYEKIVDLRRPAVALAAERIGEVAASLAGEERDPNVALAERYTDLLLLARR